MDPTRLRCPVCSTVASADALFCTQCGKRLRDLVPAPGSSPYYAAVQESRGQPGVWTQVTAGYSTVGAALSAINRPADGSGTIVTGDVKTVIVLMQAAAEEAGEGLRRMIAFVWVPLLWSSMQWSWLQQASEPNHPPAIDIADTGEIPG